MISGWVSGAVTALLLLCFIGVVLWAYSSRRKEEFERAARLPLEAEEIKDNREVRS